MNFALKLNIGMDRKVKLEVKLEVKLVVNLRMVINMSSVPVLDMILELGKIVLILLMFSYFGSLELNIHKSSLSVFDKERSDKN